WSEGTERYKEYTRDDVLNALGIPDGRMPSFNAFLDPKGEKTYWRDRGWFEDDANVKLPCNPRWHQLIGMLALLDSAFNGKNILLMDEVGLGKTMQVAGVVALVTYFREFYAEKKDFPGAFKGRKWHGVDGNIPDLASIIVVPKSLHPQFTRELRRYLAPQSFDILPYLGR
ncbi:hypothetical protein FIBSPDRAFT_686255, partial [Athelia psychrophila]